MKFHDHSENLFGVEVSRQDVDWYNSETPNSQLRGLRGAEFEFSKRTKALADFHFKNGTLRDWQGPDLSELLGLALVFGIQKLNQSRYRANAGTQKCVSCKGPAHPATGCVVDGSKLMCGPCTIDFWKWFMEHQKRDYFRLGPSRPKEYVSFYEHVGTTGPGKVYRAKK